MKFKEILEKFKIKSSSDVQFALAHVSGKTRSEILFCDFSAKQVKNFLKVYEKLKKGYPLDLVLGYSNFYGRKFFVSRDVLKPRLDTEFVCEKSLASISEKSKVLDLCCGSGVIGITLAKEKQCFVVFSDISKKALKVCKKNTKLNEVKCRIVKSNLFEEINEKFDVIISNPPYIKTNEINSLDDNVKNFDPKLALDGGEDGLDFYRKIILQAPNFLNENGKLIFEIGSNQKKDVLNLMKENFNAQAFKDYNNNDRIIIGEIKNGKTRKNDK